MSDDFGSDASDPEETVAAAVAELDDLADRPVHEHHDRLARAHEILHRALSEAPTAADAETRH